jgi:hypothetical protein
LFVRFRIFCLEIGYNSTYKNEDRESKRFLLLFQRAGEGGRPVKASALKITREFFLPKPGGSRG